MLTLTINGKKHALDVEPDMPLLWALRDELHLTGAKYGCGVGQCGSCTVLLDNQPVKACTVPVSAAAGKSLRTIEGLAAAKLHTLQQAWIDHQVPQCGYCQTGMLMAAVALLESKPHPTDSDIDAAMTNLCRCGTYARVRSAIHAAAGGTP
jgi:isoquinoline 1-oxidoreductase alpha subunit